MRHLVTAMAGSLLAATLVLLLYVMGWLSIREWIMWAVYGWVWLMFFMLIGTALVQLAKWARSRNG